MKRILCLSFGLISLGWIGTIWADDFLLPAGTLLRCTLSEPNFSAKTMEKGDPVLCHADTLVQFGRNVFPRGAYFVGHLETSEEPGHFYGKGTLGLQFDHIGLPGMDIPFSGKVISVRGYNVNRKGEVVGHGHATRDTVEWLLPPLWPWKVITLPGRGPQPTLKGEVPITIRLMETVALPQMSDASWQHFGPPSASVVPQSFTRPTASPATYVSTRRTAELRPVSNALPLTLLAFKNEMIFGASDYWIEDGRLIYILSNGTRRTADLTDINWSRTNELNSERGVRILLRSGPANYTAGVP